MNVALEDAETSRVDLRHLERGWFGAYSSAGVELGCYRTYPLYPNKVQIMIHIPSICVLPRNFSVPPPSCDPVWVGGKSLNVGIASPYMDTHFR